MIYLFVILIILYGVIHFDIKGYVQGRQRHLYFVWIVLVLIAGFRYKIGGDTYAYMINFATIPTIENLRKIDVMDSRYQPLWVYFFSMIRTFTSSFYIFQFVHALIVNTAFFYFFEKHSRHFFTCILFYSLFLFFNYNTEILRASLSVSIFLLSYDFLLDKKWIPYILCIIFAVGFHAEAFLMCLFPLCHIFKNDSIKKSIIVLFFLSLGITAFNFIPIISDYLSAYFYIQKTFDIYTEEQQFAFNFNGIVVYVFKNSIWLLLLWLIKDKVTYNRLFVYLFIICMALSFKFNVILSRIQDFTYPVLVLEIVSLLYNSKTKLKYLVMLGVMYSWSNFYLGKLSGTYSYVQYYPYTSYFNETKILERDRVVDFYHPNL